MAFLLFTWNLQRQRTISSTRAGSISHDELRLDVLKDLVSRCRFGFITEPGLDLRSALVDEEDIGELPDAVNLYRDTGTDNQDESSACRPILASKDRSDLQLGTARTSGAIHAYRYPCAQVIAIEGIKVLLVSLHSTSGASGKANTKEIIKHYCTQVRKEKYGGMIVGGDFNAHIDAFGEDYVYKMPGDPTNQGAGADSGGIDGFYFFSNKKLKKGGRRIEFLPKEPQPYYSWSGAKYKSALVRSSTVQDASKAGFWIFDKYAGRDRQTKLSDHAPVVIKIDTRVVTV